MRTNWYFAHYRLGFKYYIIQVGAPESYKISGFFESILTRYGAEMSEIS
jgi:hypothetical protein